MATAGLTRVCWIEGVTGGRHLNLTLRHLRAKPLHRPIQRLDVPMPCDTPPANIAKLSCVEFRSLRKNMLRGIASLRWQKAQLIVHGVAIHEKNGKFWVQLPARPQTDRGGNTIRDRTGRVQYARMLEFFDQRASDLFSQLAVEAVAAYAPDAFDDVPAGLRLSTAS